MAHKFEAIKRDTKRKAVVIQGLIMQIGESGDLKEEMGKFLDKNY